MALTRRRLLNISLCLTLLVLLHAPAQARLGDRLAEMKGTDFFKFFNLKETGRGPLSGKPYTQVTFRPGAGNFRELVEVRVTVDREDRILGMQLSLKRSFVDDQFNGIFARDIAKSMLRAAIPAANEAAINDLANEIEFPKDMPGYDVARTKPDPRLPAQPTPGYQVFIGQRKSFVQTLSLVRVSLENVEGADGARLVVSINSKALK